MPIWIMAVFVSNIVIEQGYDFNSTFVLEDTVTTNLLDLSNYTIQAQLRKTYSTSNHVDFVALVADATKGEVVISMASTTTTNLKEGRYVYDIKGIVGNNVLKLIEGTALVRPGVTR